MYKFLTIDSEAEVVNRLTGRPLDTVLIPALARNLYQLPLSCLHKVRVPVRRDKHSTTIDLYQARIIAEAWWRAIYRHTIPLRNRQQKMLLYSIEYTVAKLSSCKTMCTETNLLVYPRPAIDMCRSWIGANYFTDYKSTEYSNREKNILLLRFELYASLMFIKLSDLYTSSSVVKHSFCAQWIRN